MKPYPIDDAAQGHFLEARRVLAEGGDRPAVVARFYREARLAEWAAANLRHWGLRGPAYEDLHQEVQLLVYEAIVRRAQFEVDWPQLCVWLMGKLRGALTDAQRRQQPLGRRVQWAAASVCQEVERAEQRLGRHLRPAEWEELCRSRRMAPETARLVQSMISSTHWSVADAVMPAVMDGWSGMRFAQSDDQAHALAELRAQMSPATGGETVSAARLVRIASGEEDSPSLPDRRALAEVWLRHGGAPPARRRRSRAAIPAPPSVPSISSVPAVSHVSA